MHSIVRGVEGRVRIGRRIGRDQRQFARISEFDQRGFCRFLDCIVAARQLDVEAVGE
jgi:hypothetical protein